MAQAGQRHRRGRQHTESAGSEPAGTTSIPKEQVKKHSALTSTVLAELTVSAPDGTGAARFIGAAAGAESAGAADSGPRKTADEFDDARSAETRGAGFAEEAAVAGIAELAEDAAFAALASAAWLSDCS